jgi:peptide deformylase
MQLAALKNLPKKEDIKDSSLFGDALEYFKIFQQMEELCEKEQGIGLSAAQAGLPLNFFIVKADKTLASFFGVPEGKYGYFLNSRYESWSETEKVISLEGCLSLKDTKGQSRLFEVPRFASVRVEGYRLLSETVLSLEPYCYYLKHDGGGVVFQHEIDHGNGILICDIGKEVFVWKQRR